ncbi:hypothetical protein SALB1_2115 [Salinisphaera sp. LB1]|nr:hypothetical protein SALB1_2115 [Salinisphaera sp. LB1]
MRKAALFGATLAHQALVMAERDTTRPGQSADPTDIAPVLLFARYGPLKSRAVPPMYYVASNILHRQGEGEMNGYNPMGSRDQPSL